METGESSLTFRGNWRTVNPLCFEDIFENNVKRVQRFQEKRAIWILGKCQAGPEKEKNTRLQVRDGLAESELGGDVFWEESTSCLNPGVSLHSGNELPRSVFVFVL